MFENPMDQEDLHMMKDIIHLHLSFFLMLCS